MAAVLVGVGVGYLIIVFASDPSWLIGVVLFAGVALLVAFGLWAYRDHRRRKPAEEPVDGGLTYAVLEVLAGVGVGYLTNVFTTNPTWIGGVALIAATALLVVLTVRQFRDKRRSYVKSRRGARTALLAPLTRTELVPAPSSVATLLSPERAIAPLEGRDSALKDLQRWCSHEPRSPLRILDGMSGVGKSRLGVELARALPDQWAAGRWVAGSAVELVDAILVCQDRALVVVDDADTEPAAKVAALIQQISQRDGQGTIKVLLVARNSRPLRQALHGELPATLHQQWPTTTLAPIGGDGDRRRWFARAARAYAAAEGTPPPPVSDRDPWPVGADGEPMVVLQVRALLAARFRSADKITTIRTAGIGVVANEIINAEQRRWTHTAGDERWGIPPTVTAEARMQAVLALTLIRPYSQKEAAELLGRLPRLKGTDESILRNIVVWAQHLYPSGPGQLEPGAPEFLAGAMLSRLAEDTDADLLESLEMAAAAELNPTVLAQLIRASTLFPGVISLIDRVLKERPELVTHAIETLAGKALSPRHLQPLLLSTLAAQGPTSEVTAHLLDLTKEPGWGAVRVALWTRAIHDARQVAETDDNAKNRVVLARSLTNLSASLGDVVENARAVDAGKEAVALCRRLVADDPARHTRRLVRSLTSLGIALREVGEYDRAVTTLQEAVALSRGLVADDPARHTRRLVRSLISLGVGLGSVDNQDSAIAAQQEAVDLSRGLVADDPARYRSDLAPALASLGISLCQVGDYDRAVTTLREAIDLYRGLTADCPTPYRLDLAASLTILGTSLSRIGEHDRAVDAGKDAVALYRELVADDPDARYTRLLVGCLTSLGISLSNLGEHDRALVADDEAVSLSRGLVADDPAKYTPVLAMSVTNVGASRSNINDHVQAEVAQREAVDLYRGLVAHDPAEYTPGLATSLINLTTTLDLHGRSEESLTLRGEVVARWSHLCELDPGVHDAELAQAKAQFDQYCTERGSLEPLDFRSN